MRIKNSIKFLTGTLFVLMFSANIFSQSISEDKNILLPPIEGLVAVHHPDLKDLEKEVREQLSSFQDSLAKTAKANPVNATTLSNSYGTLGQIYHAYSFFESAEECYLNAAKLAPKDFKWVYLLGKVFKDRNKINDAIYFFKKAQDLRPEYLPIHINLGNSYLELNFLFAAKESFENALKLDKDNPAALYGMGQIVYAEGNYKDAVTFFDKVLSLVPDANRVQYSLALAYRGLKDVEKAKFHLSKQGTVGVRVADPLFDGLDEFKKGVRLRLLRGKLALEAERFAEAETEFQKALAIEPENATALVNYGVTLVQLKKYSEAAKQLEKAIKINPNNINARYNLAILLSAQEKHFEAIPQLKAILKINPKDNSSRFLLAKELRFANLLQESLSEFVIVYNSSPDDEDVLLELVKLLFNRGEHKQAKELLEKSYAKFPVRGRTIATLAYLLATSPQLDLRDGKKALELSQFVFNSTKLIEHGAIVAMAYAELGQCDKAAKVAKELLDQAIKANNQSLVMKLKNELNQYENEKPCRVKN